MSVRSAPVPLARARGRRGCLGALGYLVLGALACFAAGVVLSLPQGGKVRQWHPYGPKGPVVTAYHHYTWGHVLSFEPLVPFGYDRYDIVAGEDPSGSYGHVVPVPDWIDGVSGVRVTGDASGITVTYSTGDRAFIPKANLKGR